MTKSPGGSAPSSPPSPSRSGEPTCHAQIAPAATTMNVHPAMNSANSGFIPARLQLHEFACTQATRLLPVADLEGADYTVLCARK